MVNLRINLHGNSVEFMNCGDDTDFMYFYNNVIRCMGIIQTIRTDIIIFSGFRYSNDILPSYDKTFKECLSEHIVNSNIAKSVIYR